MRKKVAFIISICLIISTVNSAVLNYTLEANGYCTTISIDPITHANEIITIAGQTSNYVDMTVQMILFSENYTLQYVPTNIFTIFPNLVNLEIINCSTTTLVTDAYANCNSLKGIFLEGGNIPNVPSGFAQSCSNVVILSLRNNSIAHIDPNAFQGMTNLAQLSLATNQLTCIPPTLFLNSRSYAFIGLNKNAITAIDYNIISGLPNLIFFDMKFNSLIYLPLLNLTGTSNDHLMCMFSNNPIKAINPNFTSSFVGSPVSFNYFEFNKIACLPAGTTSLTVTTTDLTNSPASLSTCFSNYLPSMTETETCSSPTTTTVNPTTVALFSTTIPDLICFTYPEWKEILKNFQLSQWKKHCPRFHRKKVCLHICFFVPGGDGNNDKDDKQTNSPGHAIRPNRPNRPVLNHVNQVRPGHRPFKG